MRANAIAESWSPFDNNSSEDGEVDDTSETEAAQDSTCVASPKRTTSTKASLGDSISSGLVAVADSLSLLASGRASATAPVDLGPILSRIDSMQTAQAEARAEQSKINSALLQALQGFGAK